MFLEWLQLLWNLLRATIDDVSVDLAENKVMLSLSSDVVGCCWQGLYLANSESTFWVGGLTLQRKS